MEFDAFGFFISILNFGVMFALFYHVVITPMEEAVVVRRKKVTSRLDEIRERWPPPKSWKTRQKVSLPN